MIVAQLIEGGEKKTTHMAKTCTSLGGPAGRSMDHMLIWITTQLVPQHTAVSLGNIQRKHRAEDNSSILSYSKVMLLSLPRWNFPHHTHLSPQ